LTLNCPVSSAYNQSTDVTAATALENSEKASHQHQQQQQQQQYETITQANVYQSERSAQETSRSPELTASSNNNNNLVFVKKNWPPLTEATTS
jgi:hypothetical protein